jgi:hypothetical protein
MILAQFYDQVVVVICYFFEYTPIISIILVR